MEGGRESMMSVKGMVQVGHAVFNVGVVMVLVTRE